MSWRHPFRALAFTLAAPALLAQSPGGTRPALPGSALIRGVPFVSWRETDQQEFENKRVKNPSIQAVMEMLAWYWSDAVQSPADAERLTRDKAWKGQLGDPSTSLNVPTLDSLKALVARGIPVRVGPALTPYAHPLYVVWDMIRAMGQVKGVTLPEGPRSGTLGKMLPLDSVPRLAEALRRDANIDFNPLNESTIYAARLVIGYDDARQIVIMHDPSFGPAFELAYSDFERMWGAAGHPGIAIMPPGYDVIVARHAAASERYRQRTPDERAAWDYVNGYALSAIGRPSEGIERFRAGLSIPGTADGYRHLLHLDLAISLASQGRIDDAIASAQDAARLVPDHLRVWSFLADAYPRCGLPDRGTLGAQAADQAKRLAKDKKAQERALAALPHDFIIWAP